MRSRDIREATPFKGIIRHFPPHQPLHGRSLGLCDWIAARYEQPQARRGVLPQLILRNPAQPQVQLFNQILQRIAGPSGFRSLFVRVHLGLLPAGVAGTRHMNQFFGWREKMQLRTFPGGFHGPGSADAQSAGSSSAKRTASLCSALHLPRRWLFLLRGYLQSTARRFAQLTGNGRSSLYRPAIRGRDARLLDLHRRSRPALLLAGAQGCRFDPAPLQTLPGFSSPSSRPGSKDRRPLGERSAELWRTLQNWTHRRQNSWAFPALDVTRPAFWGPPWQSWIQRWRTEAAAAVLALPPQLRRRWQGASSSGAVWRRAAAKGSAAGASPKKSAAFFLPRPARQPLQMMLARPRQTLSEEALKAVQARSAQAGSAPQAPQPPAGDAIDLFQLTHRVSDELERRIRTERERRGL